MSDNPTPTPATPSEPAASAATPSAQGGSPTPGAQVPAATTQPQTPAPFKAFATEDELKSYLTSEVSKTAAKIKSNVVRTFAREFGFEDADELREWLATQRQGQSNKQPGKPEADAATTAPAVETTRLQTAIQVAAKLGLPATLIGRLQGNTPEEMEADAQTLLGLVGYSAGKTITPGIPPPPSGNPPVTFTRTQLQDAKFVREHAAEIQAAAKEGRIVRS